MTAGRDVTPVVLFDLDGVLVDTDAFTHVVARALRRRPWRLLPALGLVAARLTVPRHGRARIRFNEALVRLALRGLDEPSYSALAYSTGTDLGNGSAPIGELIETARQHCEAGARVIVTTATERRVARSYLDAVGLTGLGLIATEVVFPPHGPAGISTYNVGEQKVAALLRLGVDLSASRLYTDSAADLPLMRRVVAVVLVEPDRATLRALDRERLRTSVTTRHLHRQPRRPREWHRRRQSSSDPCG